MENKITNFDSLFEKAKVVANRENFSEYCNKRTFEKEVTDIASNLALDDIIEAKTIEFINANHQNSELNPLCFVLFFTLYTFYRKNKIGDLEKFFNEYGSKFRHYKFTKFIELLTEYNTYADNDHLHDLLISVKKLTDPKNTKIQSEYDFSEHSGVINFYVEIVCSYYELNLDKRSEDKAKEHLNDALNKIEKVIDDGEAEKAYSKFYLNKGRVKVLQSDYVEGEKYINKAIRSVSKSANRAIVVREYEHYLTKLEMIKLYDINNSKIKEVEKLKTDNLKSLSLITALLGFLLGAISIFTTVTEVKVMALLMLTYMSLIITLLSILFVGIRLLYKEKNLKFDIFTAVLFVIGVGGFIASILFIL